MNEPLQLLTDKYLKEYEEALNPEWLSNFELLDGNKNYSISDFEFYIQASATYSSNIEGNSIDIDTYLKNKKFAVKSKPKEMNEIDDLILAYNFAKASKLSKESFLEAHKLLSKTILSLKSQKGKLRNQQVGIFSSGKIEYMAVEPELVKEEFSKLFDDVNELLSQTLTNTECFYFASMVHLMFEKNTPFYGWER